MRKTVSKKTMVGTFVSTVVFLLRFNATLYCPYFKKSTVIEITRIQNDCYFNLSFSIFEIVVVMDSDCDFWRDKLSLRCVIQGGAQGLSPAEAMCPFLRGSGFSAARYSHRRSPLFPAWSISFFRISIPGIIIPPARWKQQL